MHPCIRPLFTQALAGSAMFGATDALAASASALAIFDGISVRTDGSASLGFAGFEILEASGTTSGALADPLNAGMPFAGESSAAGERLATNAGHAGATSFASASGFALSNAFTFLDAEMLLSGTGNVSIDIGYTVDVDPLTAAFSDTLFVHTYVSAQAAPVPLPATVWLPDSAPVGMGSMRRRVTPAR